MPFTGAIAAVIRCAEEAGRPPRELNVAQSPPADRLSNVPRDARYLAVSGLASDLEILPAFGEVEILWISGVTAHALEIVGRVPSLRVLSVNALDTADLAALSQLGELRHVMICGAPALETVRGLERLPHLTTALFWDSSRVTDLSSVGNLAQLRGLQCGGGMWTTLHLESPAPLARLTRLEYLDMPAAKARDGSLKPLHGLRRLRHLALPNAYSLEEFAAVAAVLPDAEGDCLRPHWAPSLPCAACGTARLLETGKGGRFVCPRCDPARVEARARKFAACVAAARRASDRASRS